MEATNQSNQAPFEKLFIKNDETQAKIDEIVAWLIPTGNGKSDLSCLPWEVIENILHFVPPYMRNDLVRVGDFVLVANRPPYGLCIPIIEYIAQSDVEICLKEEGLSPGWLGLAYAPMDEIHDKSSSSAIINIRIMLDFYYRRRTLESILEITDPEKEMDEIENEQVIAQGLYL